MFDSIVCRWGYLYSFAWLFNDTRSPFSGMENPWNLRPLFLSGNSHRQISYTEYISPSFTLKWQPFIFHSVPNLGKYKENYQIYSYRFERILYCFACILNPIALSQSTTKGNKIEVKKKHRIDSFRKAQEHILSYWH